MEKCDAIEVYNSSHFCIAGLSCAGRLARSGRLSRIKEIRVLGIIRRTADDRRGDYRHLARIQSWEVPLMEAVLGDTCKM